MIVRIDPKSNIPLYEQIIQQVKEMCVKGILKPDDKLPSVRELSSSIVINPNTVSKAYQELERQGVIVTLRGKGTFVAEHQIQEATEKQVIAMKKELEKIIIECKYLGITIDEMNKWVQEIYREMREQADDRS
ncbi:GntR family transcriptional regulator [Bacillus alkalicellulosilyticus]|uniref:GntR family transcriptional regulator n=1 Tax=Alkalihalobacterium alkalicellulosilyticum TaxID=1912214 RepID=UPI000998934D|nr:GntR family transcriptional regulator [Bacillus alkalicellulosilyticus]